MFGRCDALDGDVMYTCRANQACEMVKDIEELKIELGRILEEHDGTQV